MSWTRQEIYGGLVFFALAAVLLLRPHVAVPGDRPFLPQGTALIKDMGMTTFDINPGELDTDLQLNTGHLLLVDIRSRTEFDHFHMPGAMHISFEHLLGHRGPLCQNGNRVVVYDMAGLDGRAAQAAILLRMGDCRASWLRGGLVAWLVHHNYNVDESLLATHRDLLYAEYAGLGMDRKTIDADRTAAPPTQSRPAPPIQLPEQSQTQREGC